MNKCFIGDCLDVLPTLDAKSVNCCVTSPPYFGLRDYGVAGQIGLEQTPDEYVAKLVAVFREVRRVLCDDGTLWLNLGDSYTGSANNGGVESKTMVGTQAATGKNLPSKRGAGLKSKDLIGIPWRVAFALQADGWYLRQDIIWHKPNPMPESVRDRCTKAHEYIFLLAKSEKYYCDMGSVKEPCSESNIEDFKNRKTLDNKGKGDDTYEQARPDLCRSRDAYMPADFKRNRRSVWTVSTKPYGGAHFATFPTELIEPCILAGCPVGGVVLDPFMGSGTTGFVAQKLSRKWVGIELNPEYEKLQKERTVQDSLILVA